MSGRGGWNYAVRIYDDAERERAAAPSVWAEWREAGIKGFHQPHAIRYPYRTTCSNHLRSAACSPAVAEVSWNYVTGKGGRVSTMRRQLCAECLKRFQRKHPEAVCPSTGSPSRS